MSREAVAVSSFHHEDYDNRVKIKKEENRLNLKGKYISIFPEQPTGHNLPSRKLPRTNTIHYNKITFNNKKLFYLYKWDPAVSVHLEGQECFPKESAYHATKIYNISVGNLEYVYSSTPENIEL